MLYNLAEFELTQDIRDLGFTRIYTIDKTLKVDNASTNTTCKYFKGDLEQTMKALRKALNYTGHFTPNQIEKFIMLFYDVWINAEERKSNQNEQIEDDVIVQQQQKIKDETNKLKSENSNISFLDWQEQLIKRFNKIQSIAESNFPNSWPGIEFTLSVLRILNIAECDLPFAGIILSRAGGNKTLSSGMVIPWYNVYYTRNFTAKAFVSHNTGVTPEMLPDIDMIPKIRFKLFLTPELTPTFAANEDELRETIGIITSVVDGKGYISNSGAQGRRGYYGNYMFTWVGAAVDIPYKIHKLLAVLGPKLYFFRLPRTEKTNDELLDCLNAKFTEKYKQVQDTIIEYLKWFEICPKLFEDQETKLLKMVWDSGADSQGAKEYIVKLGRLLGKLRGHVDMWTSKSGTEHEHEYSGYEYAFTDTEDPARACTELYNIARGHALLTDRNSIRLKEDLPIAVKVVLSTAAIERVAILDLLLAKKEITVSEIARTLSMSKSTALKAMTALSALGVVKMQDVLVENNTSKQIKLREEFDWLYDKEFNELREGFSPTDNSKYGSDALIVFEELESDNPDGVVDYNTLLAGIKAKGVSHNDAILMIVELIRDKVIEEIEST